MHLDIKEHIPEDFHDSSRVWIYQSSNLILISEALKLETMINAFISNWNSHGTPVKGYANLFFGRFLILMADETATGVSGCSTDSSVQWVREVEQTFKTDLFDRTKLAFFIKDKVEVIPMQQLPYAIENGFISPNTLYFDNTILTKKQLLDRWITPAGETWLKKYFQ
ncbi:MAG TPA: hypothetical protein PLS87_01790 [Ferruginibacter sp.]|nr:hypothetical protein [Ferruginibacter sp.]HRN91133.1 hypothetical protein [Ferruginibacter sp.]HRP48783.1 hypothetical protein [Ferruginibacter sp.]